MNPAIFFEPDAYALDGPRLMGRQSAGNGFLRAAVAAHAGEVIHGLTALRAKAETFARLVTAIEPKAQPRWIPAWRFDLIAARGVLYRPDSNLAIHARERLRLGPARYSICGVTHTLATHGAAETLTDLVSGPVMPWDALICTSTAARGVAETIMAAQADYYAWRFGAPAAPPRPQLPVIPLGVHAGDFAVPAGERPGARAALQIAEDEVAALFVGRLTFNAKAHPFQMYQGLEAAAQASGRRLVFILAGQFPSPPIEEGFRASAAVVCPSVRVIFVDGKDADRFGQAWRAADLFLSLPDNLQETFGITPIEAMAAGLPVVVSDWDGYKDTVRDGVDGFRIASWSPAPGVGEGFAADYETFAINYDHYLSRTSTTASVDLRMLVERLTRLIQDAELRRRMGEAGRARARSVYDWPVVYGQYGALWRELGEIRARSANDPALRLAAAPRSAASRLDPFRAFAHYPTHRIGAGTRVRAAEGASAAAYEALTGQMMLSFWRASPELVGRTLAAAQGEGITLAELARGLGEAPETAIERVARLAKMGLVELAPGEGEA